ncbi:hypothetical protein [Bradyrhizobium commune]|uniref:Cell envelope biogenesis protein TolA n=1 Tax=Bradyrhizobium commune TaxID=83627 RepID=A0A7S9D9E0_9BRAD|nr:hypothetical protein [Bradyrhizobium commune]QPF92884.1 hypothetical protein IC761_06265 [Bradyrhizobium commune]
MLKYLAKISMDIFPSVLATIIGAYIVNHYINAKPAADAPAAVVAPAQAGKNGKPADVANLPAPGVKAKGISEKNVTEKAAVEKAADKPAEQPAAETKAADLAPAETTPRGRVSAREKAAAKSSSAPTPAVAAPATVPVVEANSAPSVAPAAAGPDANDLARAAIERLRKFPESKSAEKPVEPASQSQEAARTPEAPRAQEAPRVVTAAPSAVRPLPPPITVSTPSPEAYGNGASGNGASSPATSPYTSSVGNDDPNRLTPPADIPVPVIAPPLDLRADAGAPAPRPKSNVADEMLSGVKSMFHAVLPKNVTPD